VRGPTRRRAALAGALLACTVLVLLLAGSAFALTVQGRVLRGEERAPAKGIPVSLHIVKGDE
jgi:hypothetical protein